MFPGSPAAIMLQDRDGFRSASVDRELLSDSSELLGKQNWDSTDVPSSPKSDIIIC